MGLLFSRFRKAPSSSKEILEDLEQKIKDETQKKQRYQQNEKSFIAYLLMLSFVIFILLAIVSYFYFSPTTWLEMSLYSLPLLFFPLVVYLAKKLLNMCFTHRKAQVDLKLRILYEEKRKTLNEVMEKETYKTARELLERFEPNHPSLQATPAREPPQRSNNRTPARTEGNELRQRRQQQPQTPHPAFMPRNIAMATPQVANQPHPMATPAPVTPATRNVPPGNNQAGPPSDTSSTITQQQPTGLQRIPPGMCLGVAPGPPAPSPILPRNRSNMDKFVEYLVGDGPNNRYALICQQCYSHNGMALRDEFEYLAFRCAYCYHLNPARKKRPTLLTESGSSGSLSGQQQKADVDLKGASQTDGETREQPTPRNRLHSDGDRRHTHSEHHHRRGQRSHSQSSET